MTFHNNLITRLAVLLLLLGVVMTIGTPQVSAQATNVITDDALKAAINRQLGRADLTTAVTQGDLAATTFKRLHADGSGKADGDKIEDLAGLQHATSLTYLNLANNKITNLDTTSNSLDPNMGFTNYLQPLASLIELKYLNLGNNKLEDKTRTTGTPPVVELPSDANAALKPLDTLVKLEQLILTRNKIVKIVALEPLTKLRQVALIDNRISDFSPLVRNSGLATGDQVWMGGNPFGSTFYNDALHSVETTYAAVLISRGVTLYGTLGQVVLIADRGLRTLLKNQTLYQSLNQEGWLDRLTAEATKVPRPPGVTSLIIDPSTIRGPIENEPLTGGVLRTLTQLNASYDATDPNTQSIDVLQGLEHCTNLEWLSLNGQFLGDSAWPIIGQLTKLKTLSLSDANLAEPWDEEEPPALKFLENLPELTHLDLSNNFIADPTSLAKLTKLEALDLRSNDIGFLPEDFINLRNLRRLYLDDNSLEYRRESLVQEIGGAQYYDAPPDHELTSSLYLTYAMLQEMANRQPLITDFPIVKSVEFVEPEFAYGQNGLLLLKVTFNSKMGFLTSTSAFREGRPYLALRIGTPELQLDAETNPIYTADWIEDGSAVWHWTEGAHEVDPDGNYIKETETNPDGTVSVSYRPLSQPDDVPDDPLTGQPFVRPYEFRGVDYGNRDEAGRSLTRYQRMRDGKWIDPLDYFENIKYPLAGNTPVETGDTMEFAYFIPPTARDASNIDIEWLAGGPLNHWGPETNVISVDAGVNIQEPSRQDAYRLGAVWFRHLSRPTKPIITTRPTVELRRADGETGTVQGSFDVELVFSAPLGPVSADVLEDHISLGGDVAGVSIESLSRPGPPTTAFQKETWTLSVSAAGVNGDVTVTLDPNGLTDVATPGNPVASEGSVLSVTVPVVTPVTPPLVTPKTDGYAIGDALEMSILFTDDGVTYEGSTPPYITFYLGERVQANERHATWARAEDVNSTLVTFAYEVAPGDVAQSVSIKSEAGIAVPRGATVTLGTERIVGNAPPPVESGEVPPATQPASGRPDPGVPAAGDSPLIGGASTVISLNTASVRVTATEIPVDIRGGIVWIPPEETEEKSDASGVPRTPIVFNELGNGSGDTNDWLEFRNVTGSAVSLKDWTLSVVSDAKKEDKSLIAFPDVSVPANGLLLIVNTSPDKTLLARGDNIEGSAEKNGGSAQPYLVNPGLSLPDDGKFLLILRNAKDKLGKNEAFVDVAGGGGSDTDAFVRNQEGDYDTHVWPLQVREAPGANTEGALGSGKVYQRAKADVVGYHKDAWAEAAFTGLGYDRKVTQSAATAGTPGYPNGALKTGSDTPKGSITFSEIMVDSGGGKLPQWIELYNRSKTEAININRWQLEIQNVDSEDLVGRPIVTLTLGAKIIQPNQTLLIVSGDARASSAARLPADRVYNLFKLHEKNLRIKNPRDTFLSAEGFYLKLTDSNGTKIDEIGNTDGNRRTNDAPVWALAMSAEEGVRSSLIRRYTDGKSEAKNGMLSGNWVLAAHVRRFVAGSEDFHWGHADDIGTPGYRKGGPLPVELSSFSVKRTEQGAVVLTWTTESEVDNAGFNLRRSEKRASGFTLINPALIAGAGTTGERQTYTFTDTSAKPGVEYYYQIEEVSFAGRPSTLVTRMLPGPVSASNRALTTFGELKAKE